MMPKFALNAVGCILSALVAYAAGSMLLPLIPDEVLITAIWAAVYFTLMAIPICILRLVAQSLGVWE